MGTVNLSSLILLTRRFFANRSDMTDEIITDHLNLAQEQIAKEYDWEELDATLTGNLTITSTIKDDKFFTIPTTVKEITSFRLITSDGRSRKVQSISVRNFDADIPEPEYYARNIPQRYCVHASKIEMWPVPDIAYEYIIRTTNWPTAFAGDTSVFSDLDRKDLPLIYRTASIMYDALGEYEKAKRFFNIYNSLMKKDVSEEVSMPDRNIMPRSEAIRQKPGITGDGQPWRDPWVKGT